MRNFIYSSLFICSFFLVSPAAYSDSYFDDWRPSLRMDTSGGMFDQFGGAIRFASDFPEFIDVLELRADQRDTGNTLQFAQSSTVTLTVGGGDEKTGFRYGVDIYRSVVEITTASIKDTYDRFGIKINADLKVYEFYPVWLDESASVFIGGIFNYRQFDGRLPLGPEQVTLLGGKIMVQFVDTFGFDEFHLTLQSSETDSVNLYTGVPLWDVCDIGFDSSLIVRLGGRKKITEHLAASAHIGAMKDSCDQSMIPEGALSVGWVW